MLTVCLDMQSAMGPCTGVGRYTRELARALPRGAAPDRLRFFWLDFKRRGLPVPTEGVETRAIGWCPGRVMQGLWKTLGAPPFDVLAGRAEVYHFPNFIRPPLRRGKSVVTLHDLAFVRMPETTEPKNQRYLERHIRHTVAEADAIVTVSRFTADEAHELLGVPRERLHPIPLGLVARAQPTPETIGAMRQRLGLDRPYLLTVGTVEPRKNLPFMADVFERLAFDGDWVIAGSCGWRYAPIVDRLSASPRAERIRRIDYVPEEDLAPLYAGAELFLFPSRYEGFGFPPLEAMQLGVPVVASDRGSLPEVLGQAARLLPIDAPEPWIHEIQTLLTDSGARKALQEAGRLQASSYRWDRTAESTWTVYRALV